MVVVAAAEVESDCPFRDPSSADEVSMFKLQMEATEMVEELEEIRGLQLIKDEVTEACCRRACRPTILSHVSRLERSGMVR